MPTSATSSPQLSIADSLQPFVDRHEIAGVSFLVAQDGQIWQSGCLGFADLKAAIPMREDTVFWVASMTKPVVSAAVLALADEDRVDLDDPVAKHLPEFGELWFLAEKSEDRRVLERTGSPTLRQLLAHADGLTDVPLPHAGTPLAEWVASVARQPMQFRPGQSWAYNNSGMNTLGRVVEVIAEQPLPDFLRERFFEPLGMSDTTFILSRKQEERLAVSYKFLPETNRLAPVPIFLLKTAPTSPRLTICPGGGLFSTTTDMFAFYQMLLNDGESRGRRLLSEKICREMATCQTEGLTAGFTEGMGFGLGVGMVKQPTGLTAMLSPGTFGHGGAYGTQVWVDPVRRSASILMCQRSNLTPNPDASDLRRTFNQAVADLLSGPSPGNPA